MLERLAVIIYVHRRQLTGTNLVLPRRNPS